jgi:drug/metabolite transporter (DMT)-like permease
VSQSPATSGESTIPARSLTLGALAGLGFGGFFIFIGLGGQTLVFAPLAMSRFASLCVALALMRTRAMPLPSLRDNPIALLAGLLDTGGNLFYLLARQNTRLDVSVVLSSLYPAVTVILARALLKEDVTRAQFAGLAVSVAAVGLIAT